MERFASDVTFDAAEATLPLTPRSNAKIESYFGEIKRCVVSTLRQRPSAFLRDMLPFVKGKVKELHLPRVCKPTKEELASLSETWTKKRKKKKKPAKYLQSSSAMKVLRGRKVSRKVEGTLNNALTRTKVLQSSKCPDSDELSSDNIEQIFLELRGRRPDMAGLDPPGLGSCVRGESLPRFSTRGDGHAPFVQIINIGDHWVCITNKFTESRNEVYVYDSLIPDSHNISDNTVLQTSALLRRQEDAHIVFSVRNFCQQSQETRLCGYYAVAAAIACCNDVDPTGSVYDEVVLVREIDKRLADIRNNTLQDMDTIPCVTVLGQADVLTVVKPKKYCVCHSDQCDGFMIECTKCRNWFHERCLKAKPPPKAKRRESEQWLGPCCHETTCNVVDLTDDTSTNSTVVHEDKEKVRDSVMHCVTATDARTYMVLQLRAVLLVTRGTKFQETISQAPVNKIV